MLYVLLAGEASLPNGLNCTIFLFLFILLYNRPMSLRHDNAHVRTWFKGRFLLAKNVLHCLCSSIRLHSSGNCSRKPRDVCMHLTTHGKLCTTHSGRTYRSTDTWCIHTLPLLLGRRKVTTSEVVAREGREVDNHRQRQEGGEAMKPHFNHRQGLL